jgi:hypothetical protein
VERLLLDAEATEVVAGDSLRLSVTALDSAGRTVEFIPEWSLDSTRLGRLEPTPWEASAVFHADSGVVGRIHLGVEDPVSGRAARINEAGGVGQQGLAVVLPVRSSPGGEFVATDRLGFTVTGRFELTVPAGQHGRLALRRPELAPVQRAVQERETVSGFGYSLHLRGGVDREAVNWTLSFPRPSGADPRIARWDEETATWDTTWTDLLSDDGSSIYTTLDGSRSGVEGVWTVLVDARPLAIQGLHFNPNPFSPRGDNPLSIEMTLHSLHAQLWLTIEIYNMAGQHVRTLRDRVPVNKGRYARVDGANPPIIWDGLTDGGRRARNGRYLVRIEAEDADGRVEKLDTVVLVK